MAQTERRVSLGELNRHAGVSPVVTRQPPLSPPPQPSHISNDEDRKQAREILVRRRQKNPESKDAMLKRMFKSSKEKEKALDTTQWEFSQDELDQALTAVIRNPEPNPKNISVLLTERCVCLSSVRTKRRDRGLVKPGLSASLALQAAWALHFPPPTRLPSRRV